MRDLESPVHRSFEIEEEIMQVAEQAHGEVSCSVCGKLGEACTNTCTCPNLPTANADYLAARTRAAHSPRTNEEFVGTISSHSHGPADFH